jgi:hypothetical protein
MKLKMKMRKALTRTDQGCVTLPTPGQPRSRENPLVDSGPVELLIPKHSRWDKAGMVM